MSCGLFMMSDDPFMMSGGLLIMHI